jgi:hypothetical protein
VNDPSAQLVDLNDTIADKKFGYLYENINKLPTATWDETKSWVDDGLAT